MLKTIILLAITISFSFGLTDEQIQKIQDVYTIGKNIKASDGMTFEKTLPSIMGQESSWGEEVIGDKYDENGRLKSVYESSLGNFQIKLSTAKLTIRKYPDLMKKYGHMLYEGESVYLEYEKNKEKMEYYKSILKNTNWTARVKNGEKKAIDTISWAQRNYLKHAKIHNSLVDKAKKDTKLINKLLTNHKFGAEIGGHYLLAMYEQSKNWKNGFQRAIGRYNGGWYNYNYAHKVLDRMETVKELLKKGIIS